MGWNSQQTSNWAGWEWYDIIDPNKDDQRPQSRVKHKPYKVRPSDVSWFMNPINIPP